MAHFPAMNFYSLSCKISYTSKKELQALENFALIDATSHFDPSGPDRIGFITFITNVNHLSALYKPTYARRNTKIQKHPLTLRTGPGGSL